MFLSAYIKAPKTYSNSAIVTSEPPGYDETVTAVLFPTVLLDAKQNEKKKNTRSRGGWKKKNEKNNAVYFRR